MELAFVRSCANAAPFSLPNIWEYRAYILPQAALISGSTWSDAGVGYTRLNLPSVLRLTRSRASSLSSIRVMLLGLSSTCRAMSP